VFVVADFFVVGLALDAIGAWLLVRGLLPTPKGRFGLSFGHPETVTDIRNWVDARFGLAVLILGFMLQLAGYLVTLARETASPTGIREVVAALALAAVASGAVLAAYCLFRARLIRRRIVKTVLAANDNRWTTKSAASLLALGREAGYPVREGEETKHEYAQRIFGIELPPGVQ
jgi:hypothetical protein